MKLQLRKLLGIWLADGQAAKANHQRLLGGKENITVAAVLLTDTDNTKLAAVALVGDI